MVLCQCFLVLYSFRQVSPNSSDHKSFNGKRKFDGSRRVCVSPHTPFHIQLHPTAFKSRTNASNCAVLRSGFLLCGQAWHLLGHVFSARSQQALPRATTGDVAKHPSQTLHGGRVNFTWWPCKVQKSVSVRLFWCTWGPGQLVRWLGGRQGSWVGRWPAVRPCMPTNRPAHYA